MARGKAGFTRQPPIPGPVRQIPGEGGVVSWWAIRDPNTGNCIVVGSSDPNNCGCAPQLIIAGPFSDYASAAAVCQATPPAPPVPVGPALSTPPQRNPFSEQDYLNINNQLTELTNLQQDIGKAREAGCDTAERQRYCDFLIKRFGDLKRAYFPDRP